ncbi:MAG TPA: phosphomannomutase/phosphoglucomutase [Egibacteraceae bacterium]|jgi:phosphomannomutase|nr:phosphomannomutase/phosphoglucomutase [Egibacteraceae bacterium]
MLDLTPIVKAYDIRGLVPEQLDAEVARALGRACAVELHGEAVIVARDMRPSSPELAAAFIEGVRAQGVDAVDIGLASTDLLYYASGRLGLPGAIWTASHNPAAYNGLKVCRAGAEPVSLDTGLATIRDRAQSGDLPQVHATGDLRTDDLIDDYAEHVLSFLQAERMRPVKVAVDAGNGMAGLVVPPVFAGLPVDLVPLYFELDGTFPNHPANPIEPENLVDLQAAVTAEGCALGLAFDGDADRMFCVDERGRPVAPSLVTAVIAETLLGRHPGETVLYNLICSKIVPETIEAAGGSAIRTRVGHSFIKALMKDTGAIFAGEHSGHYYFRDNFRADSGLIAAVLLLEALGEHGGTLSEIIAPYDRYVQSGEVNTEVVDQDAATNRVAEAFSDSGDADWADGLTVDGGDWWFNLRPSNTEPLLRLNVEAKDRATMERVRDRVLELVRT